MRPTSEAFDRFLRDEAGYYFQEEKLNEKALKASKRGTTLYEKRIHKKLERQESLFTVDGDQIEAEEADTSSTRGKSNKTVTISESEVIIHKRYLESIDGPLVDKRDPSFYLNPFKCFRYFSRDDIPDGSVGASSNLDIPQIGLKSRLDDFSPPLFPRLGDPPQRTPINAVDYIHEDTKPVTITGKVALQRRRLGKLTKERLLKIPPYTVFKRAAYQYSRCCLFKVYLLGLLTLGIWNNDLVKNMEIEALAKHFDWDVTDDITCHDETLTNIGLGHSLIWQFFPGCVFVAKLGEATNDSPTFVFAKTLKLADDWQTRSVKFFMSIAKLVCTLAIACLPNLYWFLVANRVG